MSLDQLEHLINISDNSPDNEKRAEAARYSIYNVYFKDWVPFLII